ncbi:3-oxoacyl-ACP synthase [bacterium (Candidatus Blackallbacteria) CG17_big_fil_post_rev_8_21_14_2_50_48_46]|uniref:3-oxoacyl-ACP synthase n=1 Tax=bacterium (Candidatus Blackallbacteria) CG17_big_fil_post_rev_8_21_14_2_50_48_46 TaxID=2014261 RepID=A0A2M7FZZ6_9BACT|nr:MAG: 3-oxoacyl-ACP synthase [bacterium (Candidatus Blackallbacteria) CG18_big_fil_WC_8_21_14_2_50_49_26]PIW14886.1 MAG: 3-oxoacyl-ACP synthase [bacterium (Candidatus Blackallbacteria) CG17_big_fil_post_rev_8_21_14_2_50_48_46]PIW44326.1 MAG: 3-oxoacyl-ACP synthase [bacterium (Candidatus Blackallbacteria) CG13_big_fil_rev_8_21_14_2_50_49_14]
MLLIPHTPIGIKGLGHYLPEEQVSNQTLLNEHPLPIDDAWIRRRIGVESRHRAAASQATSDLAIAAAHKALASAQISADEIDLILLSTISPDHPNPSTACAVQAGLGISETLCPSLDISAACSGFLYGLDLATRYVLTGARNVLLISAEIRSRFTDPKDPATFPIFGDGAGAAVIGPVETGKGVKGIRLLADGRGYYSVHIPAGGSRNPTRQETLERREHFIRMENGEKIFFEVVEGMSAYTQEFLKTLNCELSDLDFLVPHQANLHILKEVARRLTLPLEKVLMTIQSTGNTSSASIPICLSHYWEQGILQPGHTVCLVAAGAGHTGGLALVRF